MHPIINFSSKEFFYIKIYIIPIYTINPKLINDAVDINWKTVFVYFLNN